MPRPLRHALTAAGIAAAVGAALLAAGAPARADPPTVPPYRAYVGVGSATTDDVMNALAGDVAGITGTNRNIGSYDASGSDQIVTRRGGPAWHRPTDSAAGLTALSDALLGLTDQGVDLTGQVQFARSSFGPTTSGNALTYVPFARDAVTYVYRGAVAQLGRLTSVQQTTAPDGDAGALSAVNEILPFSAAQWIAQRNGLTTDTTALARLGATNGTPAAVVDTGTGQFRPVATFYNSAPFGSNVYNVIPTILVGDGRISRVFVGNASSVCNAAAKTIVRRYGLLAINPAATGGPACGDASVTGDYTP